MYKFVSITVFGCLVLGLCSLYGYDRKPKLQTSGITCSIGYQQIPGKYYEDEWTQVYRDGVSSATRVSQIDQSMGLANIIVRVNKMVPLSIIENILVGMEVGYGMSLGTFTKEWSLPSSTIPVLATGEYTWNDGTALTTAYQMSSKEEVAILATIPILAKAAYNLPVTEKASIRVGLGLGGYIVNVRQKSVVTYTYVNDSGNWKTGDKRILSSSTQDTAIALPATELNITIPVALNKNISLGFSANMSMLGSAKILTETTVVSSPDPATALPVKTDVKDGIEIGGGTAIGINAGITLRF